MRLVYVIQSSSFRQKLHFQTVKCVSIKLSRYSHRDYKTKTIQICKQHNHRIFASTLDYSIVKRENIKYQIMKYCVNENTGSCNSPPKFEKSLINYIQHSNTVKLSCFCVYRHLRMSKCIYVCQLACTYKKKRVWIINNKI